MGCGSSTSSGINPSQGSRGSRRAEPPQEYIGPDGRVTSKPVAPPSSYRYGKPITVNELHRLRDEFWGTRVEGNRMMWQAIHSACDAILNSDLGLANAILEASGIATPSASLSLCYDERGQSYSVPEYCYCAPTDLLSTSATAQPSATSTPVKPTDSPKPSVKLTPKTGGTPLKIKVRINPGDYNVTLDVFSNHTISDVKKLVELVAVESNGKLPACEEQQQRVMFMGKELQGGQTVKQVGFDDSRVVQVFIRPKKP